MTSYLCCLSPENPQPQSNHEEKVRHIPVEGCCIKFLNSVSENGQSHPKQGMSETLSQPKGTEET